MASNPEATQYRRQIIDYGYAIVRELIPSNRLQDLRQTFETLAERQFDRWRSDPDPENQWPVAFFARQPRLLLQTVVDESTPDCIDLCLGNSTLGVSREIMGAPAAAPTLMSMMCNPAKDYGPDKWHRDIRPSALAPLRGIQDDSRANGPAYVQWNIPLYDDTVLWVVPGSHWRINTAAENKALSCQPDMPLPGGVPVDLAAGDAVVYLNTMLHWGSNYSTNRRRTIHLGYRAFGSAIYPHANGFNWDLGFTAKIGDHHREQFEGFFALHEQERRVIESVLRAVLRSDPDLFQEQLADLHPGQHGRMVALTLLSKFVNRLDGISRQQRVGFELRKDIADAFSPKDHLALRRRFARLDTALRADGGSVMPGFQEEHSDYEFNAMPERFGVDEFIASWDSAA